MTMKTLIIQVLAWILKKLAQLTIWRFRPGVIGITGSVGKTSAKMAIATVLRGERKVRWSKGNLNNELGLPLTILGEWSEEELKLVSRGEAAGKKLIPKLAFWIRVICFSAWQAAFGKQADYPEILILEYGADKPGDIKKLLSVVRPNVGVITAIGEVPVHVEFYAGPEEVAKEKGRLIECLPAASFAVLNGDEVRVANLADRSRAHVMTFGFDKDVDVRVSNMENRADNARPLGMSFKLEYGGNVVPVRIDGVFGKAHAYAAAVAASVGIIFGMNLVRIAEALRDYIPVHGRMELLPGVKYTYILNDCYNASPLSMRAALDTLKFLPAKRKIAVLGDMLEIGKYAIEEHEKLGRVVTGIADILITVGPRGKFIAEGAKKAGMNKRHIQSFDLAGEAQAPVQALIKKGDLILIKASRAMHLEDVVEEIRAF
ncbi:MAG: UDP-N-acetylmuramoyl-tripeptide--D-alanyl-D-alanine ligase [Patescibacteria group bacterium]